jgi:hypothetical protein
VRCGKIPRLLGALVGGARERVLSTEQENLSGNGEYFSTTEGRTHRKCVSGLVQRHGPELEGASR